MSKKRIEVEEARRELAIAEERKRMAANSWQTVAHMLDETAALLKSSQVADPAYRAKIFAWWLDHVEVAIEKVAGKTGAEVTSKTLLVWLNTSPSDPRSATLPLRYGKPAGTRTVSSHQDASSGRSRGGARE